MSNPFNLKRISAILLTASLASFSNIGSINAYAATSTIITGQSTKTITTSILSNSTVTIVGNPYTFNSGATYNVASLSELQSKLGDAIANCQDSVTLNYTGSTPLSQYGSGLSSIVKDVMQTAGNDYEKNILYQWSCSYTTPATPQFTVTYNFKYLETSDQRQQVTDKVNQIISTIIQPDMTDEQKEKAINDYICLNVAYDTSLVQHSAYAALFGNKKTVCQGYALLAYRMLTAAGLQARIITGTANGVAHAWNLVQINGNWYHLDCTWDDPIPDAIGRVRYDYFNLQDSQIKAKSHSWNSAFYPVANSLYSPTDPDIINGGRSVDFKATAPDATKVTITNNLTKADTIALTGLNAGDIVKIYKDGTTTTTIAKATVAAGKTDLIITIPQLGTDAGSIFATITSIGTFESDRTKLDFIGEPKTADPDPSNIVVSNNVDKPDTVLFKGLHSKDMAKVYAADGVTVIGTATATLDGDLNVILTKKLDESTLKIKATIKNDGKRESNQVDVSYIAEAVTTAPDVSTISVANNVGKADTLTIKGLHSKDIVKVYAADTKTILGTAAAAKDGDLILSLPKQLDESALKVFVTIKNDNKRESSQVEVDYNAEIVTTSPIGTDVLDTDGITVKTPANVIVTNNVDKADTVLFKGLHAKDIAKVYSADGKTVIGTATAVKDGDITITLAKPLDETALKVKVSVKSDNQRESTLVDAAYSSEAVTGKLSTNNIIAVDNAVFVFGLSSNDIIKVYDAATGKTIIGTAKVAKGQRYALVTLKSIVSTAYITVKSDNKRESDKILVTFE